MLKNKTVMVYGAYGGLGKAIVDKALSLGGRVILAGRNQDKLNRLARQWEIPMESRSFAMGPDLDPAYFDSVDYLINAVGRDVRKKFIHQNPQEVSDQIDGNLLGPIFLTQAALHSFEKRGEGRILHIGGFGEAEWHSPYYTVDYASRAGLFGFFKAINLELDNPKIGVQYFCPSPAETPAEEPFHPLWRSMGIPIYTTERVATEIFIALKKETPSVVMGNVFMKIYRWLRRVFPGFTERVIIRQMAEKTRDFFESYKGGA